LNTLSITIAAATLVVGAACLFVAWLQYRRMPKPPEPACQPSVIAFDVVPMKQPPGLPGYDGKCRNVASIASLIDRHAFSATSFAGPCLEPGLTGTEPQRAVKQLIFCRKSGAGEGIRTLDPNLGKVGK